jgi:hypothetical protein
MSEGACRIKRRAGELLFALGLVSVVDCACGGRTTLLEPSTLEGGEGGEQPQTGGRTTGGRATGGTTTGGVPTGGSATGGETTGGVATGGVATGGAATGGVATGGTGKGGATTGGVPPTGGAATGGTATGGSATGGDGAEPIRGCRAYGRIVRGDDCADCRARADLECYAYYEADLPQVCPGSAQCSKRHCVYGCEPDRCEEDTCECIVDCIPVRQNECRAAWEKITECYARYCADACPAKAD